MTKLWDKGNNINKEIEEFTVGNDYKLDKELIKYDIKASIAHAKMLNKIGILTDEELTEIKTKLSEANIEIKQSDEDCHTAIENYLGEIGKKIHTGRSRNDQVMTALRLYIIDKLKETKELTKTLIKTLEKEDNTPMPGYTHMQKAMPTTIKTWLSSFKDMLEDDLKLIDTQLTILNQNPLGSAAGFGTNLNIDKEITTKELNFSKTQSNPIYCANSRGKFEAQTLHTLTNIMQTLNKLSTDLILFSMQEFNYIKIPKEFCTGSSIMPQKNNQDCLELIRAKYNVVLGYEFTVKNIISNLMTGYNRDFQLTKEPIIKGFKETLKSLKIMNLIVENIEINKDSLQKAMTKELFATEKAYELVKKGMPFRDAYKEIGKEFKE